MPEQPFATIIIPLLRQADDWLKHSVESALNQTVPCQVLVITSPQTSPSNLRILEQLRRNTNLEVHQQQRSGFAAALNTGIAMSRTGRIGFLLSDDWLQPNAVEECMRYSTDVVCGGIRHYGADGIRELLRFQKRLTLAEFRRQPTLEQKAKYLQHFLLFQKHKLEEVGGLDESLGDWPGVDDYDLIWVLLERGASVTIVDKSLYNYRDHDGERLTLRKPADALANLARIFAKHRVPPGERRELIAAYRVWFGKRLDAVNPRISTSALASRFVKTDADVHAWLAAGFSASEYFPHEVHYCRREQSSHLQSGQNWQLDVYPAGENLPAAQADISCDEDTMYVNSVHAQDGLQETYAIVVNALLDFALDSGILGVYWPTASQMSNNAIAQRYSAKKTSVGPIEYWKIEIHENSARIVLLEFQTARRRMNILFTSPSYYPNKGGAESAIEDLASCFVRHNYRTLIVTCWNSVRSPRKETRNGVEIFRLKYPPQRPRLHLLPAILVGCVRMLGQFAKIIRTQKIDVVCVGLVGFESVFVVLLRQFLRFRLIIYVRGGELRSYVRVSRLMRWSLARGLRLCDAVIAVSQQLQKEAMAFEPAATKKIIVLPDAIDPAAVEAEPEYHHDRPYVLFAGRLHPVKGIDILIEAFKTVAAQTHDLDLLIVGTGHIESSLKELVLRYGLAKRVTFLGAQDRPAVFSLLKGCEFVVLPSHAEGCPLIVLEAMAAGKMTIGSRAKGIIELIDDGRTGVLFDEGDSDGLSRLIVEYHRSTSRRRKLETNIKAAGVPAHDVKKLYKKHLDAYRPPTNS
jgi:glycosyltransferase involved in cell wall biosynthesis